MLVNMHAQRLRYFLLSDVDNNVPKSDCVTVKPRVDVIYGKQDGEGEGLLRLISKIPNVVISQGYIDRAFNGLNGMYCYNAYVYGLEISTLEEKITCLVCRYTEYLRAKHYSNLGTISITHCRSKNFLVIGNLRISLHPFENIVDILRTIPVDSLAYVFGVGGCYFSPRSRRAIGRGYNIADKTKLSKEYLMCLAMECDRGFGVTFPFLNSTYFGDNNIKIGNVVLSHESDNIYTVHSTIDMYTDITNEELNIIDLHSESYMETFMFREQYRIDDTTSYYPYISDTPMFQNRCIYFTLPHVVIDKVPEEKHLLMLHNAIGDKEDINKAYRIEIMKRLATLRQTLSSLPTPILNKSMYSLPNFDMISGYTVNMTPMFMVYKAAFNEATSTVSRINIPEIIVKILRSYVMLVTREMYLC